MIRSIILINNDLSYQNINLMTLIDNKKYDFHLVQTTFVRFKKSKSSIKILVEN